MMTTVSLAHLFFFLCSPESSRSPLIICYIMLFGGILALCPFKRQSLYNLMATSHEHSVRYMLLRL